MTLGVGKDIVRTQKTLTIKEKMINVTNIKLFLKKILTKWQAIAKEHIFAIHATDKGLVCRTTTKKALQKQHNIKCTEYTIHRSYPNAQWAQKKMLNVRFQGTQHETTRKWPCTPAQW